MQQSTEVESATASPDSGRGRPAKKAKKAAVGKRFYCYHCQRYFARLEHLQRHARTHTRERPYICQLCSQDFSRSDLLVRHHRLVHRDDEENAAIQNDPKSTQPGGISSDLRRAEDISTYRHMHQHAIDGANAPSERTQSTETAAAEVNAGSNNFQTLSAAVDYAAALELLASQPQAPNHNYMLHPGTHPSLSADSLLSNHNPGMDFEQYLDNLAWSLEDEPFTGHNFSSWVGADQPMPLFSPETGTAHPDQSHTQELDEGQTLGDFSRFGSRLPSLQPEEGQAAASGNQRRRAFFDVSSQERQLLQDQLASFAAVVPSSFILPSCLALSRYIAGYINGFHDHLPFLHVTTASVAHYPVELTLAVAAVGSQYCYEHEKGVELFRASLAVAHERIRRRDTLLVTQHENMSIDGHNTTPGVGTSQSGDYTSSSPGSLVLGPLGLPRGVRGIQNASENLIQTAQAMLLLMAMATWAKHKVIFRESLALQSILATLVRDDGLEDLEEPEDMGWEDWIRFESAKRTKYLVYCFFNLHCIVYNIPPLILSSEIRLTLPSSGAEFRATNETDWRRAKAVSPAPLKFQDCFLGLFVRLDKDNVRSSLGNYILIHALIQQIFFVRQTAQCRPGSKGELSSDETTSLEHALRNWQRGWKLNPASSLDPLNPNGRVAFNSTALLRLAYIRLNVDLGPLRGLNTRDPSQIARMFRESPRIRRTPRLVRAILHCAHALSIPIKLGVGLVARTQTFFWSIQHSLCSLECAFLLSKWLSALAEPNPAPEISKDERRIVALVKTMLDETEFGVYGGDGIIDHSPEMIQHLSAGVLRVWAKIFKGSSTWAIVDIIGSSLNIYAELLGTSV